MLRLLMVDDHRMLTEALTVRLSTTPDVWVVGRLAGADAVVPGKAADLRPDVVTVDVEPLGTTCRDLLERLGRDCPAARLVVLTSSHDVQRAVDAARAGATAWVPKEHGVEVLTDVLRAVCRGEAWYPPDVLGTVLRELRADVVRTRHRSGPLDVLSARERDVLAGMADGKRGNRIAEELRISAQTVRTHTRSILAKLNVHSQLEAVRVAREAGLCSPLPQHPHRRAVVERAP